MERISLGTRLRQLRLASGLTQEKLSEKTAGVVSLSWISSIERRAPHPTTGKPAHPTKSMVQALATALGISYLDLVQGTNYQEDFEETANVHTNGLLLVIVPGMEGSDIVIVDQHGITKRVKRSDSNGLPEMAASLYVN